MNRRGFLQSLIAGAGLVALPTAALSAIKTVAPELFYLRGDGVTDDTLALQALFDGKAVIGPDGKILAPVVSGGGTPIYLPKGTYRIGRAF